MWPITFEERLQEWVDLRQNCHDLALESCLLTINDWWARAPVVNHYLHWDDHRSWPGPWDLLADNMFCEVAKSLGIVYTIMMIERSDIEQIEIMDMEDSNLVQVNRGKYILNWCPGQLLNTCSLQQQPRKVLGSDALRHLLG